MAFKHDFLAVLTAMEIAYGIKPEEETLKNVYQTDVPDAGYDIGFMRGLIKLIREHWDNRLSEVQKAKKMRRK